MSAVPDDHGFTVEYALTEDDVVAFVSVPFGRTPLLQYSPGVMRFFVFVAVIVTLPLLALLTDSQDWWDAPAVRHRAVAIIGVVLVVVFVFERPILNLLLRRRIRAGKYAGLMQQRRLEITVSGVRSVTRSQDITTSWVEIKTIGVKPTGVYLIDERGRGYLIPQRAFADASACAAFLQIARRFKNGSDRLSQDRPTDQMDRRG